MLAWAPEGVRKIDVYKLIVVEVSDMSRIIWNSLDGDPSSLLHL